MSEQDSGPTPCAPHTVPIDISYFNGSSWDKVTCNGSEQQIVRVLNNYPDAVSAFAHKGGKLIGRYYKEQGCWNKSRT